MILLYLYMTIVMCATPGMYGPNYYFYTLITPAIMSLNDCSREGLKYRQLDRGHLQKKPVNKPK